MKRDSFGGKVTEKYFGSPLANGQGCDEPYDPAFKARFEDGQIMNGRGSQGSGSKPTPQRALTTTGSGIRGGSRVHNSGSYPRHSQKIRG